MALKTSARWHRKEREISFLQKNSRPNQMLDKGHGKKVSAADLAEEILRDEEEGEKSLEDLFS